jgi:hypothetical protein
MRFISGLFLGPHAVTIAAVPSIRAFWVVIVYLSEPGLASLSLFPLDLEFTVCEISS